MAIARKGKGGSMTIPELADSEGLSQPHIGKLMSILRKSGFVNSTRGQVGGYHLSRNPADLVLGEILFALGGKLYFDQFCDRHSGVMDRCVHESDCNLRVVWSRTQDAVDSVVMQLTLADVLNQRSETLISLESISSRRPGQGQPVS